MVAFIVLRAQIGNNCLLEKNEVDVHWSEPVDASECLRKSFIMILK